MCLLKHLDCAYWALSPFKHLDLVCQGTHGARLTICKPVGQSIPMSQVNKVKIGKAELLSEGLMSQLGDGGASLHLPV